jgi:hypothetical protein
MIGIAALACVSICGLMSTLVSLKMVDMVNDRLPEVERFGALGWHFSKTQRLHREYRRLHPDGQLLVRLRVLMALSAVCLLICAWSLGFFGN